MSHFVWRFTYRTASGFVLSLLVRILGLFNKPRFFGWLTVPLHVGIFVALLRAVIAYIRLGQLEGKAFGSRHGELLQFGCGGCSFYSLSTLLETSSSSGMNRSS